MKKIIFALGMAFASWGTLGAQNYLIEGTAPDMDGQKVYIGEMKSRKDIRYVDSTTVAGGAFKMAGKLDSIQPLSIFIGKKQQAFLLDENPIKVNYTTTTKEFMGQQIKSGVIQVTGDKDQQLLADMNTAITQEMYTMLAISFMGKDKDVNAPENKALADSIGQLYTSAKANTKAVFDKIVNENPDSYVSAIILNKHLAKERPLAEIKAQYEKLSQRVKQSNLGRELKATIAGYSAIGVGRIAPDFTLNTPEGKSITLSSLRSKCVLLDFWASWCGPCLREAPNIKKVYDKYHAKGFEVLSVSVDDDKAKWIEAIRKHQLNWLHVSALKGWKCPVAQLYKISGVPAMFLIDQNGKIVSTKARGEALEKEVSKLCK